MVPEQYLPLIQRIKELWFHRNDCYAEAFVTWDDGHPPKAKMAYHPKDIPVTLDVIARHAILKQIVIGAYQFRPDGTVKWICWDVDDDLGREDRFHVQITALEVVDVLKRLGLEPATLFEDSGNKGYHSWLFFDQPIPGYLAQAFGLYVKSQVDIADGIHIEVFPKNTRQDGYGNLVKLPFCNHPKTGRKSELVDPGFQPVVAGDAIDALTPIGRGEFEDLLDSLGIDRRDQPSRPGANRADVPSEKGLPCTSELLAQGVDRGARQEATFRLAYRLQNQGLPGDIATKVLEDWDHGKNKPPLSEDDPQEFQRAIANGLNWKEGLGCGSDFMRQHCHARCPVYQKIYAPGEGPDVANDRRVASVVQRAKPVEASPSADENAGMISDAGLPNQAGASATLRLLRYSEEDGLVFGRDDLEYHCFGARTKRMQVGVYRAGRKLASDVMDLAELRARSRLAKAVIKADESIPVIGVENDLTVLEDLVRDEHGKMATGATNSAKNLVYSLTPAEEREAIEQLKRPDLAEQINNAIGRLGVVGEKENRMLIYLAYTSRLLDEPINVIVKGESSSGKSYLSRRVLQLMPATSYEEVADLTPQALFYLEDDALKHRILVIYEYRSDATESSKKAEQNIRIAQTEGLKIKYATKNEETGAMETRTKELHGPIMFLTTTTNALIHPENETRNLSLYTTDNKEQTQRVLRARAEVAGKTFQGMSEQELMMWQNLQRVLKPEQVVIPYASVVADLFPKEPVRVRRDFSKFLNLIKTIALLHQFQRDRITINDVPHIVANEADYRLAFQLAGPVFADSLWGMSPKAREIFDYIIKSQPVGEFTRIDIATGMKMSERTVQRWLYQLTQAGLVIEQNPDSGGRGRVRRYALSAYWQDKKGSLGLPPELPAGIVSGFTLYSDEAETNTAAETLKPTQCEEPHFSGGPISVSLEEAEKSLELRGGKVSGFWELSQEALRLADERRDT